MMGRSLYGVIVKILDCSPEKSEFELQSCNCVHSRTKTPEKDIDPHLSPE